MTQLNQTILICLVWMHVILCFDPWKWWFRIILISHYCNSGIPRQQGFPFLWCNGKEILTFSWGNGFLQHYELVKFCLPCISSPHQSAKKWQAIENSDFFMMLPRNPQHAALGAVCAAGFAAERRDNLALSMRMVQWPEIHGIWLCFMRKRGSANPTLVLHKPTALVLVPRNPPFNNGSYIFLILGGDAPACGLMVPCIQISPYDWCACTSS